MLRLPKQRKCYAVQKSHICKVLHSDRVRGAANQIHSANKTSETLQATPSVIYQLETERVLNYLTGASPFTRIYFSTHNKDNKAYRGVCSGSLSSSSSQLASSFAAKCLSSYALLMLLVVTTRNCRTFLQNIDITSSLIAFAGQPAL